jgi:uncharacterized protein (DUF4415 family)
MVSYSKEQLLKMRAQSLSHDINDEDIQKGIDADPDTFEITQVMINSGEVKLVKGRGKNKAATKIQKTVRFDPEVLAYFEVDKSGWQKRLAQGLKMYMSEHPHRPLEP